MLMICPLLSMVNRSYLWITHPSWYIGSDAVTRFTRSLGRWDKTFARTLAYRWEWECCAEFEIVATTMGLGESFSWHWNAIVRRLIGIEHRSRRSRCWGCGTESWEYHLTKAARIHSVVQWNTNITLWHYRFHFHLCSIVSAIFNSLIRFILKYVQFIHWNRNTTMQFLIYTYFHPFIALPRIFKRLIDYIDNWNEASRWTQK